MFPPQTVACDLVPSWRAADTSSSRSLRSLSRRRRKRASVTLATPISLETDEAASLSHAPLLRSLNDVSFAFRDEPNALRLLLGRGRNVG